MSSTLIIFILSGILGILTFAQKFPSYHWLIRMWDYMRIQLAVLQFILFLICSYRLFDNKVHFLLPSVWLFYCISQNLIKILPLSIYGRIQVSTSSGNKSPLTLFLGNVLQTNPHKHALLKVIAQKNPDIILLTETDETWESELEKMERVYPHNIRQPQDNLYGMHLYSKFPLHNTSIQFLTRPDVPSMRTELHTPAGKIIFYGVHPKPPAPNESPNSIHKDLELRVLSSQIGEEKLPVLLGGDFNDVAWSETTQQMLKNGNLLDPRRGRGLHSTFPSYVPSILRFPVDHVLHTKHFEFKSLETIKIKGSDHLGLIYEFTL